MKAKLVFESLKLTDEMRDYHSGQSYHSATISDDDKLIGYADYSIYDNELSIDMIEIEPEFRRQGYGKKLMAYIKLKNSEAKYVPSLKTDLGTKFVF